MTKEEKSEAHRAYMKLWWARNREKAKGYREKWLSGHPGYYTKMPKTEESRALGRKRSADYRDKLGNKERANAKARARYAAKKKEKENEEKNENRERGFRRGELGKAVGDRKGS